MKYLYIFLLSVFFLSGHAFAHKQTVHQHIVREAFKLLKLSYPNLNTSEMEQYIGSTERKDPPKKSFGPGKIVSGAWIEDEYDIVYHYGIGRLPLSNEPWRHELLAAFGNERKAYTSITHFWDADAGPSSTTRLWDNSSYGAWDLFCENAFMKISQYRNGGYNCRWLYDGVIPIPGWPLFGEGYDFEYRSLFDLYNNGNYRINGYLGSGFVFIEIGDPFWAQTGSSTRKRWAYEILGRMAHLIGDMSVPAHVHNDSHACAEGMNCDDYEETAPYLHLYTADEVYNSTSTSFGGTYINPYNSWNGSDPLYYLMYFMNQISDHYPSTRVDGDNNYDLSCPGLSGIMSNLGPAPVKGDIDGNLLNEMQSTLMPLAIRTTAGLLYWFLVETGQAPGPLAVSISGPSHVNIPVKIGTYNTYTWTANTTNATNPVYKWYYNNKYLSGYNGNTFTSKIYYTKYSYNFNLKVVVTDVGDREATATKVVTAVKSINKSSESGNYVGTPPENFALKDSYPNPFNPVTTVPFDLPENSYVKISVYNTLGQKMVELANSYFNAGAHKVELHAENFPSGVYIIRAEFVSSDNKKQYTFMKKALLVK